jgi:hypothetical protein
MCYGLGKYRITRVKLEIVNANNSCFFLKYDVGPKCVEYSTHSNMSRETKSTVCLHGKTFVRNMTIQKSGQERQTTYDVIFRRVLVTMFAVEKQ